MRNNSEPDRRTEERLLSVLDELMAREPIFHHPQLGTTRADFESMVESGFWETGASGQRYSRECVIETLVERHKKPLQEQWQTDDFHCQELAQNLYLLTYSLLQGARSTRRSTIWRRASSGWKIVYHQGTIVQGASL